jgi:NAD(P)-dependent dehydrogenase (short-subunit alcohol dehydrogenase family)
MTGAPIALITGASSGIGLACVSALVADGWYVVATARNPAGAPELQQLIAQSAAAEARMLDVTDPAAVTACVDAVLADHGAIDLLVNNAGVGHRGTLEQVSDEQLAATFDVNFWGVVRLTRAVIPGMRQRRSGRVVTITSTNGIVGMPFSDAYNAAKFAVEGLMEGLAPVVRHFGITLSVVEPGPVRTSFLRNAHGPVDDVAADDPYAPLLSRYNAMMAGLLSTGESAEQVADLLARIATEPDPHFRYQSSDIASSIAQQKFTDPTGDAVIDATSALLDAK